VGQNLKTESVPASLGYITAAFRFAILFLHSSKGYTATTEHCFASQKQGKHCQSPFAKSLVLLSCATFPPVDALADKNRIPKAKLSVFGTSQLSSGLIFR